jgi:hypothetical protein
MDNINYCNCLSVKNKQNIMLQCQNKKKENSIYCGKHMNNKHIISYKEMYDEYKNKKTKIEHPTENEITKQESLIIKNQILTKDDLLNNILHNVQMDVSTIRTSIKKSSLHYMIYTKQSKSCLVKSLKDFIQQERFYISNASKIIKIQSYVRKWIIQRRSKCTNDDDILCMVNKYEIQYPYFYPFYDDIRNQYYAYDIRSLYELIHSNYSVCPYALRLLNDKEKETIEKYVEKLKQDNIPIQEEIHFDEHEDQEMKIKELFYNINMLDNYTDHVWFTNLSIYQLIDLYIKAEDIWNYRAMLTQDAKKNIIGEEVIFQVPLYAVKNEKSIFLMRKLLLKYFTIMISNGIDINEKKLGAILVLSALVEISPEAFEAMPHLAQL